MTDHRKHTCDGHTDGHIHRRDCGHKPVLKDGHIDYVVGEHLHHPHGLHCHDHGPADRRG